MKSTFLANQWRLADEVAQLARAAADDLIRADEATDAVALAVGAAAVLARAAEIAAVASERIEEVVCGR